MVDFEFDEKTYKRVDIDGTKYILLDNIQGSKMLFNRYPLRGKYDVYYGMIFYGCFPKGTKILGKSRDSNYPHSYNIEDVRIGDKVLSYNERSGEKEYKEITKTFVKKSSDFVYLSFSNGNRLRLTPEHPIAVINNGNIVWTRAGDIEIGDKVIQKESPSVNIGIANIKRNASLGRKLSDETKSRISSRISDRNKSMWNDPNSSFNMPFYKRMKVATLERTAESTQSYEEHILFNWLEQVFPGQWILNDNFYIDGCKPDFIHSSKHKVIEWNGCYWHGCNICGFKDRKNARTRDANKIDIYNKNGYDCLTLWEHSSKEDILKEVERFSFNPDISIILIIDKSFHFIEEKIGYENDNWVLEYKNGVYSIWKTIDGFIVKELRKTKEFFNKIDEAIAYIEDMNKSYLEDVYNLEVKDNNNYFAKGILVHNCWEPKETQFVKRFVKSGMTTMDVGVYLGYYTLLFSKLVGGSGKVISVEPSGESMKIVSRSAKINRYDNITYCEMALSDTIGTCKFDDDLLLIDDDYHKNDNNRISITTCDTLLDALRDRKLDFVKIDTDGYDGNVILGMMETFDRNPELVVMLEYFPQMWDRVGVKPIEFKKFLEDNDLNAFVLGENCELIDACWDELLSFPEMRSFSIGDVLKSTYPDRTLIVTRLGKERLAFYLERK